MRVIQTIFVVAIVPVSQVRVGSWLYGMTRDNFLLGRFMCILR